MNKVFTLNKLSRIPVLLGLGLVGSIASAQNLQMNDMSLKSELDW